MKTLILLITLLTSTISFASEDYHCSFRNYNIDIFLTNDESTSMFITNRFTYDTIYVGYVGWIERKAKKTNFHFYGNSGEITLTFKNEDLTNEPDRLSGAVDADLEGFWIVDQFKCQKR